MDKDARIARLQARLVAINYERAAIDAEIAALTSQEQMEAVETNNGAAPGALDRVLTANEKIALFRSLFRGRADVFPVRWENPKNGKSGYSPACDNEWRKGLCGKPKIKCSGCPNQGFIAISDDLIKQHLRISHRNDIPHHRGPARDVPGSRLVRCHGRLSSGVLCLTWPAREPAQGGQLRPVGRDPAPPRRASRPLYGAPRIRAALRGLGHTASRGRIERLMRRQGVRAVTPRRFRVCTTDSHHDLPIAPNRLGQKFAAERPNQVWLADISYVPTSEGFHQEDRWLGDA